MAPPRRIVRRTPLMERVRAYLNPMDFLLWLSEEIETRDWDTGSVGTQLGLAVNFLFLLSCANSGGAREDYDVFGDDAGSGWLTFAVSNVPSLPAHTRGCRCLLHGTPLSL